jgi:hypothetical protein
MFINEKIIIINSNQEPMAAVEAAGQQKQQQQPVETELESMDLDLINSSVLCSLGT